jgi:large subunit ribosomal protein L3
VKGLLGKKLGTTQVFDEQGQLIPVTVLQVGHCQITQIKKVESDGYNAVQLGFEDKSEKRVTKPLQGHFKKAGVKPKKYLAEVRVEDLNEYKVGDELKVDIFSDITKVNVTAKSKGRGFSGVVKRWGFRGGPGSHGAHFHRAPGSIGASATPSRVAKGKKMPGHYGNQQVTVRNLKVVKVDAENNLLLVKGAVPGAKGTIVKVRAAT